MLLCLPQALFFKAPWQLWDSLWLRLIYFPLNTLQRAVCQLLIQTRGHRHPEGRTWLPSAALAMWEQQALHGLTRSYQLGAIGSSPALRFGAQWTPRVSACTSESHLIHGQAAARLWEAKAAEMKSCCSPVLGFVWVNDRFSTILHKIKSGQWRYSEDTIMHPGFMSLVLGWSYLMSISEYF